MTKYVLYVTYQKNFGLFGRDDNNLNTRRTTCNHEYAFDTIGQAQRVAESLLGAGYTSNPVECITLIEEHH